MTAPPAGSSLERAPRAVVGLGRLQWALFVGFLITLAIAVTTVVIPELQQAESGQHSTSE